MEKPAAPAPRLKESGQSSRSRWETIRPILKVVIPVVLFLVAVATLAGGWQQLAAARIQVNPITAVGSFAVLLVAIAWASLLWTYMARVFGAPLTWRDGVRVYATSNLGKYLPGKVGHIFARVYLAREN